MLNKYNIKLNKFNKNNKKTIENLVNISYNVVKK